MAVSQTPEQSLTSAISNEIVNTSVDTSLDYSEMVLDSFLSDGVLKEIPIIKTLYAFGKIGSSIKERFFIKKLFVFLKEFHSQTVSQQKLDQFKTKFDSNENYRNEVTEQIIIYLDTFLSLEKSKILAKLFRAHIEGKFDWEHLNHLSECLNSLNPKGFTFLQKLSQNGFKISEDSSQSLVQRDGESEALLYACGIAYQSSSWSSAFNVSELGKDLYNFGIL